MTTTTTNAQEAWPLREPFEMISIVLDDLEVIAAATPRADHRDGFDEVQKRAMIRTMFAGIEAVIFAVKKSALALCDHNGIAVEQNTREEAKRERSRLPFAVKIEFSMNLLAQATNNDFRVDTKSEDWERLQAAISLRNRLTHPNSPVDLSVSTAETREASAAFAWVCTRLSELIEAASPPA